MGKAVLFLSGKGGVGKTTLAASIGRELAKTKRVLLAELDSGFRGLDILLGKENILYHLKDNLASEDRTVGVIRTAGGLDILPAGAETDFVPDEKALKARVEEFLNDYDFLLLDAPCGWSQTVQSACKAADEAVLIVTPDAVSTRGAATVGEKAYALHLERQRVLINMVRENRPADNPMTDFDEIINEVCAPLLGVIPYDKQVYATLGKPAEIKGLFGECIAATAKRLAGEQVPLLIT